MSSGCGGGGNGNSATPVTPVNSGLSARPGAMPRLGSAQIDTAGVALLTSWVNALAGGN
jgi:hypothetical protein